jgi:hypothetical protein
VELFYLPIQPFLIAPWLAPAPAALFWWGFRRSRSKAAAVAAVIWLIYTIYEWFMYEWGKTVIAPIRVDLPLIVPFLYLVSAIGALGFLAARRRR